MYPLFLIFYLFLIADFFHSILPIRLKVYLELCSYFVCARTNKDIIII